MTEVSHSPRGERGLKLLYMAGRGPRAAVAPLAGSVG